MVGRFGSQLMRGRRAPGTLTLAAMLAFVAAPSALATPGGGNSASTITASFADSCRDFVAHSSKDISHVEIHYLDGRVVKDESISSHDYAVDGGGGDEIEFAIIKSGTTSEQFDCVQSNSAPAALLEIKTPECHEFFSGGLVCEQSFPRTTWTGTSDFPETGGSQSGLLTWGCGAFTDRSLCSFTFSFRGTGSSDPDGDITSWSLDFGDGASASGSWITAPPTELAHGYSANGCQLCVITLTVTDSSGQSHSNTMKIVFLDQSPD